MNKIPMTNEGLSKLQEELNQLLSKQRPKIIEAIAEARSHGDLSENAEYQYAKEQQSLIEGKILELESVIANAEIIAMALLVGFALYVLWISFKYLEANIKSSPSSNLFVIFSKSFGSVDPSA